MPKIVRGARAQSDVMQIALYLEMEASEELSESFLDCFEETLELLARMPMMGRTLEFKRAPSDLRLWRVGGSFSAYLIVYRPIKNGIEVIRVLHGARDLPHEIELD